MTAGRVIAYIAAAILVLFGALFLLGAFSPEGSPGWILVGLGLLAAGFVLIWLAGRKGAKEGAAGEVVQRIELSGDVSLERFTCKVCGGQLSTENVKMVAGAPVVNCPYCGTSYQLEEAPKW
ncbi:MAG TPA: hypothetical protein VLD63_15020 [Anaerolineales bacterium]|nr:hypothetical protein [Anaerolineales bacterium]